MLLLVLCGRILAMPGWMPTVTQETLTVTLCSDVGTVDIHFDREHDPDKHAADHSKPCVFASATDNGPPPVGAAPVRALWLASSSYHQPALAIGTAQGGTQLPPATGPPTA